jgi:hypothetical protein
MDKTNSLLEYLYFAVHIIFRPSSVTHSLFYLCFILTVPAQNGQQQALISPLLLNVYNVVLGRPKTTFFRD